MRRGRRPQGGRDEERGAGEGAALPGSVGERLVGGEVAPPPSATLIGMRLASFAAGETVVLLDAGAAHGNPMGTVQGGILAALADAAMGWAYMTTLGEGGA